MTPLTLTRLVAYSFSILLDPTGISIIYIYINGTVYLFLFREPEIPASPGLQTLPFSPTLSHLAALHFAKEFQTLAPATASSSCPHGTVEGHHIRLHLAGWFTNHPSLQRQAPPDVLERLPGAQWLQASSKWFRSCLKAHGVNGWQEAPNSVGEWEDHVW